MTASFSASLAPSNPATSSHLTLGLSVTMAEQLFLELRLFVVWGIFSLVEGTSTSFARSLALLVHDVLQVLGANVALRF